MPPAASLQLENLFASGQVWVPDAPSLPISQQKSVPFGIQEIDEALPHRGLTLGAVHEWIAAEGLPFPATPLVTLAANALKATQQNYPAGGSADGGRENYPAGGSRKCLVWIGKNIWPSPFVLARAFAENITRCFLIDLPQNRARAWAIDLILRSPAVAAAIIECRDLSFNEARRFMLSAKQSGVLAILVRSSKALTAPFLVASRWQLTPAPSTTAYPCFEFSLVRQRGALLQKSKWLVEFNPYDETDCLLISPRVADISGTESNFKSAAGEQRRFGT